ncbi:transposase (fragment) [Escherichia coli]
MRHVRCFQWLGGVPELVVPDNLKSATPRACKYDPDVNPTYQQMLEHYNVAVLPARPRKPRDKAKAEVGVQVVERWIMARIRHELFYSLASLNQRIHYYSVPCSLLGQQLEAWISGELVRLFNQGQEVAVHPRKRTYGYSTRNEHMPEAHQQHATWTPERLLDRRLHTCGCHPRSTDSWQYQDRT